jgi:hypothetical protein
MDSLFGFAQGRLGRLSPHELYEFHAHSYRSKKENIMSNSINPEAAQPTTTQAFEQSDRNPTVTKWGGRAAGGGQINAPASSKSMVTEPGPAISPDAGLQNYDTGDIADGVEDEAEREG